MHLGNTAATAGDGRDVLPRHGGRVALWRSPVTVDKVTQSCFEKIYAQSWLLIMVIEEHLDLNQLFEEALSDAFRFCISFAYRRRKRPMKAANLKSFHTKPHFSVNKFAPKIYQGLA